MYRKKSFGVLHNHEHVSLAHKYLCSDGSWGYTVLEEGHIDLCMAINLAGELLEGAGGMLQMQAAELRKAADKQRKRESRTKKKA